MAPTRTCVGCRRRAPAGELVRLVLDDEGLPVASPSSRGRGAWLCAGSERCLVRAVEQGRLERALRPPAPWGSSRTGALFERLRSTRGLTG
ncbi:MAG TPA: YlxR family protein [Acidimicrobiales bacterium]